MITLQAKTQRTLVALPAVAALLLACGACMCAATACGASLDASNVLACLAGALVGAAAGAVQTLRPRYKLAVPFALVALAIILCGALHGLAFGGFASMVQGVQHNVFLLNGHFFMPIEGANPAGVGLVLAVSGALLSFVTFHACRNALFPWPIVCLLVVIGLSLLGWCPTPAVVVFVLGMALCLAACSLGRLQSWTVRSIARGVMGCLALVVVLCGVATGIGLAAGLQTPAPGSVLQTLQQQFNKDSGHALNQGNLAANADLNLSDSSALKLTVEQGEADVLYLRGFTGDRYQDGSWQQLDCSQVEAFGPTALWLDQQGFAPQSQLSYAANQCNWDENPSSVLSVQNTGARKAAYLPYCFAGESSLKMSAVPSWPVASGSVSAYDARVRLGLTHQAYKVQEGALEQARMDAGQKAYDQFVRDSYLDVPENARKALEALLGQEKDLGVEQVKYLIDTYLGTYFSYDPTPTAPEGEADPLLWFMVDSRAGYSQHYASLATMMLRYYGVPARYVEGYYAKLPDRDGTTTVNVTENDAHAWAEYYLEGVGWLPFDVTPGYGDPATFYELTDNTTTSQDPKLQGVLSRMSSAVSPWKPQVITQDDADASEETVPTNREAQLSALLWAALALLALLMVVLAARIAWARRRLARLLTAIEGQDAAAVSRAFSYLVMLCTRYFGCDFGTVPFALCGSVAKESGACSAEAFKAAALANDQALFAPELTDENAAAAVRAALDEIMGKLAAKRTGFARLWDRFVMGRY